MTCASPSMPWAATSLEALPSSLPADAARTDAAHARPLDALSRLLNALSTSRADANAVMVQPQPVPGAMFSELDERRARAKRSAVGREAKPYLGITDPVVLRRT